MRCESDPAGQKIETVSGRLRRSTAPAIIDVRMYVLRRICDATVFSQHT